MRSTEHRAADRRRPAITPPRRKRLPHAATAARPIGCPAATATTAAIVTTTTTVTAVTAAADTASFYTVPTDRRGGCTSRSR